MNPPLTELDLIIDYIKFFARILKITWRDLDVEQKLETVGVTDNTARIEMRKKLQVRLEKYNGAAQVEKASVTGSKTIAQTIAYMVRLAGFQEKAPGGFI